MVQLSLHFKTFCSKSLQTAQRAQHYIKEPFINGHILRRNSRLMS